MRELARLVGLSYGTLRVYRSEGRVPEPDFVKDGKPFWLKETADRWKAERGQAATH